MAETATPFAAPGAAPAPAGRPAEAGFTLAEMLVVVALIAIGAGVTIPLTMEMVNRAKNDSSVVVAQTFIDSARDRAVAERRNVELEFRMPNRLLMYRIEVPSGVKTLIGEMQLEGAQEFRKFPGVTDTPDAFGASSAVSFTGTMPVMFTSDGSLIDSQGDVVNGSVFFGVPDRPESARAVTVFGITGMIRTWKWRGAQWFE
jgi:prepilin-type N-terminal cleavage/methylation domain-containing protein